MDFELHVTGKKLGWGFCLKAVWIVVTVSILQIGLGTCLAGDSPCFQAGMTMEGFMFVLTFPSSVLFVILSPVIFGWESIHSITGYFLFWLGMFVVGLVQWFFLAPKLFEGDIITSLGLIPKVSSRPGAPTRRKCRSRIQNSRDVKPFDADGHTPIERVLRAGDR